MNNSIRKRIISVLVAFSFICTTLVYPLEFMVSAASIPDTYGDNLLSGLTVTAHYSLDGNTRTPITNGTFPRINDGDLTSEFFIGNPVYFAEEVNGEKVYYTDGTKVFLDLQFDLGEVKNAQAFYMLNHSNDMLRTKRYQLYLSDNADNLFSSDKLEVDYTNANKDQENLLVFDETVSARYVGIRILNPISTQISNVTQVYTRILEVALLGNNPTLEEKYGTNLLKDLTMSAEYSLDGGATLQPTTNGIIKNINDGNEDSEFFIGTPKFAENVEGSNVFYTDGSKVFLNLYFNLGAQQKINAFYMVNSANDLLRTKRYKIYIAKKQSDLFDDSKSLVKDYTNEGNEQKNLIVFDEAAEGQYLGIQILNPVSREISNANDVYTRINEVYLFGEELPPPTIEGENLLPGTSVLAYYSTNGTDRTQLKDNGLFKNINDGDAATEFFTSTPRFAEEIGGNKVFYKDGSKVYLDLIFDLEEAQKINALSLINNSNAMLRTKRVKVFLSNKMSELFHEDNLVADVSNDNEKEQLDYILSEPAEARFFAIRILNPICSEGVTVANAFTRLQEVMLFGERKESNVSVTAEDFTPNEDVISALKASDNLLYDKEYYEILQSDGGVDTSDNGGRFMLTHAKCLTNGIANDAAFFPGTVYFNSDGTPRNTAPYEDVSSYTSISYYLGGEAEIDEVWLYNHSNKDLSNYVYDVYISDSNLTLFEESSFVKRYTNTAKNTLQKFKFKNSCKGRYIGIRFLVPVPTSSSVSDSDKYLRLSQIAAFGSVTPETVKSAYSDLYAEYDYNLLKDRLPEVYGKGEKNYEEIEGNFKNLTDEKLENEIKVDSVKFAELEDGSLKFYENGDRYVDFLFDFETTVDIKAISLTNHPTESRRNYKYSFYGADSREELFTADSLLEEFENTSKEEVNTFKYNTGKEYKFFALRVTDPLCGEVDLKEAIVRICDLAVFGSYTDPDYKINNVVGIINLTEDEFAAMGKSLISGVQAPKWFYNNATIPAPWAYVEQSKLLTDGKIDKHADYTDSKFKLSTSDGSNKLDVMYSFNEMYDFSGFTFLGTSDVASSAYYTGWYQVYISEDPDELFLPENMVFEYNWLDSGAYRGHNVTFDNYKARGMAFGIRILNPVTTATVWPIPRLTEIAVYGEKAIVEILPTNLAANMPVTAYTEDSKGNMQEISDSNLTPKEIKRMVDGNTETAASITAAQGKVHLLYNLCNDVLLTDLKLDSNAKAYKVYASDDINEVWNEDSLLYSYKGSRTGGKKLTGKAASKKYRYVRFEITDFSGPLKIREASVIGGDNQLLKYKQVSRTFSPTNVVLTSYNYTEKKRDFINTDAYFYKLFDNDIYTSIGIWGGKHNEETLDLTITFDDVKNIDSIAVYFPDMLDGYNPTRMEVYASENLARLNEGVPEDEEPIKVFEGLATDGLYQVDFKPQFARIMTIRLICGNQEYDGYDDYMCFALNEVKVMGTAVVGIQTDETAEELLTFTDSKTGISADVLKYDKNDIFTDVTGIKVQKLSATVEQKKALAESGSLKVIDDAVYKVDFVDRFGNVVKDLGGRSYRIRLPYDTSAVDYAMIASGESCKVLDSRVENGNVYYDKYDFEENEYMLVEFADSSDPYFDDLDVVLPDTGDISNGDDFEDFENLDGSGDPDSALDNGDNLLLEDDSLSPQTGESVPMPLPVACILFAFSSLAVVATAKRKWN